MVFTRRIASTHELASQIVQKYDQEMWNLILIAVGKKANSEPIPSSREEFNRVLGKDDFDKDQTAHVDSEDIADESLALNSVVLDFLREIGVVILYKQRLIILEKTGSDQKQMVLTVVKAVVLDFSLNIAKILIINLYIL